MTEAPGYRAYVEALIERLAQRAADGELFARLALPGWQAELDRIGGEDLTHDTAPTLTELYERT